MIKTELPPRPWTIKRRKVNKRPFMHRRVMDANGWELAKMPTSSIWLERTPQLRCYNDENLEALAALITATPDMYEALEQIRPALKNVLDMPPFNLIDPALAKARGEE